MFQRRTLGAEIAAVRDCVLCRLRIVSRSEARAVSAALSSDWRARGHDAGKPVRSFGLQGRWAVGVYVQSVVVGHVEVCLVSGSGGGDVEGLAGVSGVDESVGGVDGVTLGTGRCSGVTELDMSRDIS